MSFVVSLYSVRAFKDYLLPAIDNSDYSLMISSDLFGLSNDFEIPMEIMDGRWKFVPKRGCTIYYAQSKKPYDESPLQDGDILYATISYSEKISILIKQVETSFSVYKKYSLQNTLAITIGAGDSTTFSYNYLNLVSNGVHATISNKGTGFVVQDSSTNGTFVNSKRIMGSRQLSYGDRIDIYGLRIVYMGNFIAVNDQAAGLRINDSGLIPYEEVEIPSTSSEEDRPNSGKYLFHRSPRNIPKIETEKVEIEAPPQPKELNAQPTFMAIGPSMTMALPMLMGCALSIYATRINGGASSAFMYTGLVTAFGSATVGTIWAIVNMRHAKKVNREDELKRFDAYSEYLINCANDIKSKYAQNTEGLKEMYPEASMCCNYSQNSAELWNRNSRHEDYLTHRLGIGEIPFQVDIEIPKERFTLINDSLAEKPKMIKESYKLLRDVPVCVNLLEHRLIGIVGGEAHHGAYPVMYDLVSQIASANCYTDVKLAFIYDETRDGSASMWEFLKWFPHVWDEEKKTRFVAGNKNEASEVFYEITKVLRIRSEEHSSPGIGKQIIPKPYYVLFLEDFSLLEGELISKYIFDNEDNSGITTILMADRYEDLPNECEYIIENTEEFQGMYSVTDGLDERCRISFDNVSPVQLELFARRLARIEVSEVETGGEIPNMLTFFDMYHVSRLEEFDVMDRWKKNRTYDTIKALVGQRAGGTECYLDVHEKYHGPHGLVAGTTGSGKSETLQTYMLSLAINYSPDDIGFFVIDYKGGGMANLFDGLPHMIGQISNLSGNQVHRAMVSIKSENMRRQRIFNEHGVNNINLYTRLYKNNEAKIPVPHMFIIIDEFAELKREEPDFMRELISVAQVGRSLGVHLILATQKPSGTVDDNIWSNSKFRLCLRVQDRQDSNDMLHRPDAAYITQAGRCYLQVGNDELFELFQSAWSGATYDENAGALQTEIAKMLSENGRAALVGSHAKIKQKEGMRSRWITKLLYVIDEALKVCGCRPEDCLYDNSMANAVIKEFFKAASDKQIEYPESDYNYHRVLDMLYIYGKAVEENADVIGRNDKAHIVISMATAYGKKLPEMKEKTQLDAVVEYLAKVAKDNGYVHNLQLWLPILPTELYLSDLNGYDVRKFDGEKWPEPSNGFTLETIVGLYDDPVNQAQCPLTMDVALNGNHAIIGTVTSGKSTFLLTYLYSLANHYSPDSVNMYLLDFSSKMLGSLEKLPHVGGVMYENDEEKISKFFTMMEEVLEERKQLFKGGSYSQFIRANGTIVPAIIIVIDNMATFRNKTSDAYEGMLDTIAKEGVGYGIYLVVSAAGFGISEIRSSMSDVFRTVICLEMNDKYGYSEVLRTLHLDVLPEENVKGRGLVKIGESVLEYQTALPFAAEDDYKRGEMMEEICAKMNDAWKGKKAREIPQIPEKPVWSEFEKLDRVRSMIGQGDVLPMGYDRKKATVYGLNLRKTYCTLLSGKARTGKTNALKILMRSAKLLGGDIAVVDFGDELRSITQEVGGRYINTEQEIIDYLNSIITTFKERNALKHQCVADGLSDDDLYEKMQQFEKMYIFVADLAEFVKRVHYPAEGISPSHALITNLIEKGASHNVFWFGCYNHDDASKAVGLSVFSEFTKYKTGIHFGGNVSAQNILAFDHVSYMEQAKTVKPGIGMLPTHDYDETNMVVFPICDNVGK